MISDETAIRPARPRDARGIARVEVETWRDAYPAILPAAFLVGRLDQGRAAAKWAASIQTSARSVLVAEALEAGGAIIGYATWGGSRLKPLPDHPARAAKAGELYELYVAPAARERGIGRRFVGAAAERMIADGMGPMLVEVLADNPSRYFYEALGARLAARGHHGFWGRRLPSVVYAWDDLRALAAAYGPATR